MPSRPRILFQDDDFLTRLHGEEPLVEAGLEVVSVGDNESARRAILQADRSFDVVVLNGRLPDGRGIDLCTELRQSGLDVPILMQSGDSHFEVYREAMRAGVSDYLEKPWSQVELLERVQLLLDMPPIARQIGSKSVSPNGSNIPTAESYCIERIRSALAHLSEIRPIKGTLPIYAPNTDEHKRKDARPIALSEPEVDDLLATLKAIQIHLAHNANDIDEQTRLQATLLGFIHSAGSWLGGRANVVTDESLKLFVRVGVTLYVFHLSGLRVDLLHILVALGLKAAGN